MAKNTVKYRQTYVQLPFNPRTGICRISKKKARTLLHHWRHEHTTAAVKKNPLLALDNSAEFSHGNHIKANAIRIFIGISSEDMESFIETMDPVTHENFQKAVEEATFLLAQPPRGKPQ